MLMDSDDSTRIVGGSKSVGQCRYRLHMLVITYTHFSGRNEGENEGVCFFQKRKRDEAYVAVHPISVAPQYIPHC